MSCLCINIHVNRNNVITFFHLQKNGSKYSGDSTKRSKLSDNLANGLLKKIRHVKNILKKLKNHPIMITLEFARMTLRSLDLPQQQKNTWYFVKQRNWCPDTHRFLDVALFMQKTEEIRISVISKNLHYKQMINKMCYTFWYYCHFWSDKKINCSISCQYLAGKILQIH